MVSVPDGGDLVEESERFERLDKMREECARERERRMNLERTLQKIRGKAVVNSSTPRHRLAGRIQVIQDMCERML